MLNKILFIVAVFFSLVLAIFSQTSQTDANTTVLTPTLDQILTEAANQTLVFQQEFRNLLALETKTFTEFDKKGEARKKSIVEANFLVYQSSKNPKLSYELRNVLKVNAKTVPNSEANADQFFAELAKTTTLKSELEKIEKTSSRYDKAFDISGLTLYEGIILSDNLRPSFEFELIGKESYQGNDVFVIFYKQIETSPFISINMKGLDLNNSALEFTADIPKDLRKNNIFLKGKFWIDAKTFQIWREERELAIMTAEPLPVLQTNFEYQASSYGILVPKQINVISGEIKKKNGKFFSVKDMQIEFAYSQFRKTETDVQILDDDVK